MTLYRNYRGLYGEPVRVPERTIAKPPAIHSHEPFPFARLAAALGPRRDHFAQAVSQLGLFDDALKNPRVVAFRSAISSQRQPISGSEQRSRSYLSLISAQIKSAPASKSRSR